MSSSCFVALRQTKELAGPHEQHNQVEPACIAHGAGQHRDYLSQEFGFEWKILFPALSKR
jgi:hypothetical protein